MGTSEFCIARATMSQLNSLRSGHLFLGVLPEILNGSVWMHRNCEIEFDGKELPSGQVIGNDRAEAATGETYAPLNDMQGDPSITDAETFFG